MTELIELTLNAKELSYLVDTLNSILEGTSEYKGIILEDPAGVNLVIVLNNEADDESADDNSDH